MECNKITAAMAVVILCLLLGLIVLASWILWHYRSSASSSSSQSSPLLATISWVGLVTVLLLTALLYPLDLWLISTQLTDGQTGLPVAPQQSLQQEYLHTIRPLLKLTYMIGYSVFVGLWVLLVAPVAFHWYRLTIVDRDTEMLHSPTTHAVMHSLSTPNNTAANVWSQRLGKAIKRSWVFIGLLIAILITGYCVSWRSPGNNTILTWRFQQSLTTTIDYAVAEDMITFLTGMMLLLGMCLAYLPYTAYGLAALPIQLIKQPSEATARNVFLASPSALTDYSPNNLMATRVGGDGGLGDFATEYRQQQSLAACRRKLNAVMARYSAGTAPSMMSRQDQKLWLQLEREERLIRRQMAAEQRRRHSWWLRFRQRLIRPAELAVGSACLLLSLFILVTIVLASIERMLATFCGQRCRNNNSSNGSDGVSGTGPEWLMRPLDHLLLYRLLPNHGIILDYSVISGLLLLYLLACTIKGIRLIKLYRWFTNTADSDSHLYHNVNAYTTAIDYPGNNTETTTSLHFVSSRHDIYPHRTRPPALLVMSVLLILFLLTFQSTLMTIAPKYSTFGTQFYCNLSLTTNSPQELRQYCVAGSPHVQPCAKLWPQLMSKLPPTAQSSDVNGFTQPQTDILSTILLQSNTTTTICMQSVFSGIFQTIIERQPYLFGFGFYLAQWIFVAFSIIGFVAASLKPRKKDFSNGRRRYFDIDIENDDDNASILNNFNNHNDTDNSETPNNFIENTWQARLKRGHEQLNGSVFATYTDRAEQAVRSQTDLIDDDDDDDDDVVVVAEQRRQEQEQVGTETTPFLTNRTARRHSSWWKRLLE